MRDMSVLAEQIRNVRTAQRRFVDLWQMDALVSPTVLDRLAADMADGHRELDGEALTPPISIAGRLWSMFQNGGANDPRP